MKSLLLGSLVVAAACAAQGLCPVKPPSVPPASAVPLTQACTCDSVGSNCRWVWVQAPAPGSAPLGLGALTPLFEQAGKGAPIANPQDIALRQAQIQQSQAQNAAREEYFTRGLSNGLAWRAASRSLNKAYVTGCLGGKTPSGGPVQTAYMAGFMAAHRRLDSDTPWARLTVGDTVKALDKFYAEPANLLLPIVGAMSLLSERLAGHAQVYMDYQMARIRFVYLDAPLPTPPPEIANGKP
jgi:hypothetical protein